MPRAGRAGRPFGTGGPQSGRHIHQLRCGVASRPGGRAGVPHGGPVAGRRDIHGNRFRGSDIQKALRNGRVWDLAEDGSHVVYKPELAQHRFYNDCAPEDVEWAKSMLVPQPVGPLLSPMRVSDANFGRVPRVYIECALDNAVAPELPARCIPRCPAPRSLRCRRATRPLCLRRKNWPGSWDALARYAAAGTAV